MPYNKHLMWEKIEHLKEISRLSNKQIAIYMGVSPRTVKNWENGAAAASSQADRLDQLIAMIEDEVPFLVHQWLVDDILV